MLQIFRKKKERRKKINQTDFVSDFLSHSAHHWINQNRIYNRVFQQLFDTFNQEHINFFSKHPFIILPNEGQLCSVVYKNHTHSCIILFDQVFQWLQSATPEVALAVISHELGHLYHEHQGKKIGLLETQIQADSFAVELGFGRELIAILKDHPNGSYVTERIQFLQKVSSLKIHPIQA
jgi:hypothetical protein